MTAKTIPEMTADCRQQAEQLRRLAQLAKLRENGEISLSWDALLHSAAIIESLCVASEKALHTITRLDRSETQLIEERDRVIAALDSMFEAVTGGLPEWSSAFGFAEAIDEVTGHIFELESARRD